MARSSNPVDAYAREVVDGRVLAGKFHRLACARHLQDRANEGKSWFPFRFEMAKAERFFRFSGQLRHYKGEWAGQHVVLSGNQRFRLGSLFGWRKAGGQFRRFTTAYNEVPRKGGKTFEAAIVALYGTFFEGEPGAEGYCIATKRDQARRVFDDAKRLVMSSGLKSRITVNAANLHRLDTACKFEPLGADADSTDGLNPQVIITDEFHAMKVRDLLDVMESATGARRNPLHFQITTAGNDPVSPCGDQHEYICKILEGVIRDDATEAMFGFIAHADPEDDWLDERTWQKANPHYGVSVKPEDMRILALKAKNIPAAAAEFQQKRLNWWVNTANPCLSMDGWRKGQTDPAISPEAFAAHLEHESCYVGIDLASKIDLCALSLVFPPRPGRPKTCLLQYIWTPGDTIHDRAHVDRAPYDIWAEQGHLLTTPGSRVDHQMIREVLQQARTKFDIELIGFDPWHADTLIDQLVKEDGFSEEQVLAVPQTYQGMSSAETRFKADVLAGLVDANSCPVSAWAASNVVEQTDGKGNIFFTKKKSRGRIDPIKAAAIGYALWLRHGLPEPAPKYQVLVFGKGA